MKGRAESNRRRRTGPEDKFRILESMMGGLNLGAYLEPMGFAPRDDVRDGVTVYSLRHLPLIKPVRFHVEGDVEQRKEVVWANVHVRFAAMAAIPFWRVLVSPGHENSIYTNLQMAKIVRLNPETAENLQWVPDAVAAAKEAVNLVREPHHGHLAVFLGRFRKTGFKPFNQ